MLVKSFVLVASLLCCISHLWARQHYPDRLPEKTWLLRLNPLGLMDFNDNNISTGAEYRFKNKWSATADIAYIFDASIDNLQSTRGWIFRPAVRKYYGRQLNQYLEGELHYKYVAYTLEDWVNRNAVNGVPAYEQYTQYKLIKHVAGIQVKVGRQENVVKDWLWVELYAGLGVRAKWQDTDLPPGSTATMRRPLYNDLDRKFSVFPSFPLGLRVLFRIR
jgi:hypothetical protein